MTVGHRFKSASKNGPRFTGPVLLWWSLIQVLIEVDVQVQVSGESLEYESLRQRPRSHDITRRTPPLFLLNPPLKMAAMTLLHYTPMTLRICWSLTIRLHVKYLLTYFQHQPTRSANNVQMHATVDHGSLIVFWQESTTGNPNVMLPKMAHTMQEVDHRSAKYSSTSGEPNSPPPGAQQTVGSALRC